MKNFNPTEVDYKNLFNLLWQRTDNLCLLLSNDLTILEFNPLAKNMLNIKNTEIIHKNINHLFREKAFEPITLENINNDKIKSLVWYNNQKWTINWTLLPVSNDKNLLIGSVKITPIDIPLEIIQLENVLTFAPGLLYWKDLNSVYLGCNDEFARL